MNINLYNLPYLLFFIPLVTSFVNYLIPNKKINLLSIMGVLSLIILISTSIIPLLLIANTDLISKIGNNSMFLISEYKIGFLNIFFLILIFTSKFIELFRYNNKAQSLDYVNNKHFSYAVYLINCFSIIGLLTSNNIFNLYIYLELYSFTFYALISSYRDYELSVIAFKYFLTGVFASAITMLAVLSTYLVFGSSDITHIFNAISKIPQNEYLMLSVILIMFLMGICLKFFSFWIYFLKIKKSNTTSNFLFVSLMFVHIYLGTYLLVKLIHSVFGANILMYLKFNSIFCLIGLTLIIYYSSILFRSKNLFFIAMSLCLIDVGYVFINLGINNLHSLSSIFLILLNHSLVNLFIFLIASFLIYNYKSADITFLKVFKKYRFFITLIFISKLFLPFSVGFVADWEFILALKEAKKMYLLLPFAINKVALIFLIGKIYTSFVFEVDKKKLSYNKKSIINRNYKASFAVFSSLIVFSIFYYPGIHYIAKNLGKTVMNLENDNTKEIL